jgi:cob(I)alamin adenosyltransferase
MKTDIELHQRMMQRDSDSQQQQHLGIEKEKGLLIVFTGTGKGKSTAAFGMGLRILSHQRRLGVVQFVGGSKDSAEYRLIGTDPNCDFQVFGADCSWSSMDRNADMEAVAMGWAEAKRMIDDPSYQMVILDDLNLLLKYQYVNMDQVLRVFKRRREMLHIVVTGRHAPFELTDSADLVTEMRQVKHPYVKKGIKVQCGVEY